MWSRSSRCTALVIASLVAVAACSPGGDAERRTATTEPAGGTTAPAPEGPEAPVEPAVTPPAVAGLLTFRGNQSRTYYGEGPVPRADPSILWRFPDRPMCGISRVGGVDKEWCGTGWTGQPAVFEREGRTWLVFGAYDKAIHFLDAATGERLLPDFPVGDIVKGSVTVDPDGFPLVYTGSRDGNYRVIAIDGDEPEELWRLPADAVSPTLWNDDWDGSGLVVDDLLVEGGENSQLHVVRLHRGYGVDGRVTVAPELVFNAPGWDAQLLADLGDRNVSIEGSVAYRDGVAYFANSGGLVQGWDLSPLDTGGTPTRVFRYWMGDDVDATVVIDDEGMLYVAAEWDRGTPRAAEVGQLVKLDPSRPDDPLLWRVEDQGPPPQGFWATPAVVGTALVVPTHAGRLLGIDRGTGELLWEKQLVGPTWQSPVVVDGVLLQGDCDGVMHAYDLADPTVEPRELWQLQLGGCIESTPAVWGGRIHVGLRDGYSVAVAEG